MLKKCFENYSLFFVTVGIFLLMLLFCLYFYVSFQEPLDLKANKDAVNIEISLPVVEWNKYNSLSKKADAVASRVKIRKIAENFNVNGL